ncbi:uncharacterized protein LOC144556446 isoform X2 [Carex rostrata]
MAPVSVSKSRGKRAKTSSSVVNDANTNNPSSDSAAGSLSPTLIPRRSLRLCTVSTSPSPNHSAISGPGSTSATDGALGKRKGKSDQGRPSVQKENEKERTGTGAKMGAGEGRRMTLRSGSQIRVTPEGTTSNAEIANHNSNSSVAAATAIALRRPGRPKRHNPADQDLHQQQQEEKEMGGGDDNDKEEMDLSLRLRCRTGGDKDKGKGKLIIGVEKERTGTGTGTGAEMGAGEGRRMTLRSGSQIRVTPEGTTFNAEIANHNSSSSVAAATAIALRRPGRPKRHNPADQDLHQQQQEEKEMGGGDDNDKEEETTLEEMDLSLRLRCRTGGDKDKGKGKLIIGVEKERTGTGAEMGAGEGRRMTLRSGSQIRVTPEGTTSNTEIANHNSNSSVAAATAIALRRPGRPKRHNPADQDLHQQQQEEKEMGGGDDNGKEEETTLEEMDLSLRLRCRTGGDKDKGKGKLIIDEESGGKTHRVGSSRFMDKGKARMVVDKDSESDSDYDFINVEEHDGQFTLGEEVGPVLQGTPPAPGPMPLPRREAQRRMAIDLAPKYAYFRNDDEIADSEGDTDPESVPDAGAHDWPGPFSTAMKIIEEREAILRARQEAHSSKGRQPASAPISWIPSRDWSSFSRKPPSLQSLCINVLADNAHEIESLEALPDMVKSMLVPILCHSRKMTAHHLSELVRGSPVELRLSDCSWASEKEFEDIFTGCDVSQLKELQLDLCGRCLPDYILRASLASAPNSLPSLTKLSLKGAYSLSDDGLAAIISAAPLLSSLNLCQCSLLTSEGITYLADNLGPTLRELYIDNCQNVCAMSILPSLKKANCLEVLSMARISSVSNKFVRELIPVCGSTIKELNFAGCSDEAIAAFVEASGTKLIELSLNNIDKVGHQTATAISRRCMCLQKLDLSFCRRMSDQALGLVVDSCSSLKTVKLFGCTQVTDLFLKGHSNSSVEIIGLGGNILGDIQNRHFL